MSFAKISMNDELGRIDALHQAAENAGAQRAVAMAALAKIGSAHAFTVPYGSGYARLNQRGVADETDEVVDEAAKSRFYVHPDLVTSIVAGASPLNKMVGDMRIPFGTCAIVGGTGSGKTPLAHALASHGVDEYSVVRAGEPFAGYDVSHRTLSEDIGMASLQSKDVVIDSIKDLLSSGSNLMKGGISRSALLDLSAWSILGATLGVTFYIPLNPSENSPEVIAMMTAAAMSSASMVISYNGDSWRYSSRRGEGLQRQDGSYQFSKATRPTGARSSDTSVTMNADIDLRDTFSGLFQRNQVK